MRKLLATICSLVFLAGCGSAPPSPIGNKPPSRVDELTYGCGGRATFTAEDVEAARDAPDELLQAIEALRRTMDGAMLPGDGWFVVAETRRRSDLLAPLNDQFASASFERQGDRWKPVGWGDCLPRLELPDKSVLEWEFAPKSYPPGSEAKEIDVLVSEISCSSGRDIEGLIESDITYTESAVEVVFTAPPLEKGFYTCQGTGPVEHTLQLEEPIGERKVLDLSVYPAREPKPGTARSF